MKKTLLRVARIFSLVMFAALLVLSVLLPQVVANLCDTRDLIGSRETMSEAAVLYVTIVAFLMWAAALSALILLFLLLGLVKNGKVFTGACCSTVKICAALCFAEGLFFAAIGYWFQIAFLVFAAAILLGFCLLVVAEALREATEIKEENDLTV